tara:strand:- start:363 stop:1106 length:744 start_codon:yes stop_codon:yes gene_type:complete
MHQTEEKVTLSLDKIAWEKFKRYCAVNAFKISAKMQLMMEEEIEKGPKTKSLVEMFNEIVEKGSEEMKEGNESFQEGRSLPEVGKDSIQEDGRSFQESEGESFQEEEKGPFQSKMPFQHDIPPISAPGVEKGDEGEWKELKAPSVEVFDTPSEDDGFVPIEAEPEQVKGESVEETASHDVVAEVEEKEVVEQGSIVKDVMKKEETESGEDSIPREIPRPVTITNPNPKMIDPDAKVPTIDQLTQKRS